MPNNQQRFTSVENFILRGNIERQFYSDVFIPHSFNSDLIFYGSFNSAKQKKVRTSLFRLDYLVSSRFTAAISAHIVTTVGGSPRQLILFLKHGAVRIVPATFIVIREILITMRLNLPAASDLGAPADLLTLDANRRGCNIAISTIGVSPSPRGTFPNATVNIARRVVTILDAATTS